MDKEWFLFELSPSGFSFKQILKVNALHFSTTLLFFSFITPVHFDSCSSMSDFLWLDNRLLSKDILYAVFTALCQLLEIVGDLSERLPSPFLCDAFAFTDVSLISTTVLAAFCTNELIGSSQCIEMANKCTLQIFPLMKHIAKQYPF